MWKMWKAVDYNNQWLDNKLENVCFMSSILGELWFNSEYAWLIKLDKFKLKNNKYLKFKSIENEYPQIIFFFFCLLLKTRPFSFFFLIKNHSCACYGRSARSLQTQAGLPPRKTICFVYFTYSSKTIELMRTLNYNSNKEVMFRFSIMMSYY